MRGCHRTRPLSSCLPFVLGDVGSSLSFANGGIGPAASGLRGSSAPQATLKISARRTIGAVARYLLPTDGLRHGTINTSSRSRFTAQCVARAAGSGRPAPWQYLVCSAIWSLVVLGVGLLSFERREL